jgi:hypothetical protein
MTTALGTKILIEGLDDWVPLLSVHFLAEKVYPGLGEPALRELIVETIEGLVDRHLAQVGAITDGGFSPWSGSIDVVRLRLTEAFASNDESDWSFAAWLNNTPDGDAAARQAEALADGS